MLPGNLLSNWIYCEYVPFFFFFWWVRQRLYNQLLVSETLLSILVYDKRCFLFPSINREKWQCLCWYSDPFSHWPGRPDFFLCLLALGLLVSESKYVNKMKEKSAMTGSLCVFLSGHGYFKAERQLKVKLIIISPLKDKI